MIKRQINELSAYGNRVQKVGWKRKNNLGLFNKKIKDPSK